MTNSLYLAIPVLLPVVAGILIGFLKPLKASKPRTVFTVIALLLSSLSIIPVLLGGELSLTLFTLSDNLPIILNVDLTGKFFACLISVVWTLVGIYSFEYMEHEERLNRFYGFYVSTLGVLFGLCLSGSIITYYMFYELMSLLTVPLVMHTQAKEAVAAGVKFLVYSVVGASLALLGVFLLSPYVSSFSFAAGGVLVEGALASHKELILGASFIMILGFGTKAGMFPLQGWLPTAHPAAPSPASAVLSGIITKTGVLGMFRLIFFFIGADSIRGTWVQTAFMTLTLFTVFMGSLLASREKLLKKRLAYSSVSQVSYVLFGLSTLTPIGVLGALLHVVAHSLIKDTLFMTAGAIIEKTGKTLISDLRGIGKQMPVAMWCFTLTSVGLIGIPPCLGFVSKWYLASGSLSMASVPSFFNILGPVVLLISALLTAQYLLSIIIKGFFPGFDEEGKAFSFEKKEPTAVMLVPMIILTALSVVIGMFPNMLINLINGITALVM